MNKSTSQGPDYGRIEEALARLGNSASVAEGHGALCGMLCAGGSREGQAWMAEMLAGSEDGVARDMLGELLSHSIDQLNDPDFVFQPLLPDDQAELTVRVRALGEWVQAYLRGLGMGGVGSQKLSKDAAEGLRDLDEISKVSFDLDHADESDELAYAEVLEHVRMIAILIRQELGALDDIESVH